MNGTSKFRKIDNRIRVLIENGCKLRHRSLFFIIGKRSVDQVVLLHNILTKTLAKSDLQVLWCSKNRSDLFNTGHRKKKMKKLNDMKNVNSNSVSNDLLTQFVNKTHRRECLYRNTHTILGKTFQMCILQDFETIEPNDLARTIETVEGGGLVIFTIDNESTIAAFKDIIDSPAASKHLENDHDHTCFSPFYRRLIMSLSKNSECLFIDDLLNVLVCNTPDKDVSPVERPDRDNYEFDELKSEYDDKKFIGSLVNCCKTVDQIKCLLKCIKSITCNPKKTTISLTAARGRGKSATLGLAAAAAIASDNHAIYVTSPTPENLGTFFNFVVKGLEALDYQSIVDYIVTSDHNKNVIKIEIVKENKNHYVKYIDPNQEYHLEIADLLIIDEAAAIPLPVVRKLFGPYSVFLSSTVNGYEGTGRSLSMKLLNHLRQPSDAAASRKDGGRRFYDLTLNQPIRYESGDEVEKWLMTSLCLDAANFEQNLLSSPHPDECELYYVNRDALFSHNPVSEIFLNRMISMFTTSHYKNSPNDLKIMSDNPYHHIFCLLSPTKTKDFGIREILVAIQLSFEGHLSKRSIVKGLAQNVQPAGDLIPWTISNRLNCPNFAKLRGARVVRIATHQNAQNMGYGKKAIELLKQYFEYKFTNPNQQQSDDQNESESKKKLSVLYRKLSDRKPEELDYLGVCYGLTEPLLNFWYYNSFVPVYIAGNTNDITGEHSCIMLSSLNRTFSTDENCEQLDLPKLWYEFRSRFVNLLSIFFADVHPSLALKVLKCKQFDSISNYDSNWSKFCTESLKENYLFRLNDFDKNRDLFKSFADIFFVWNFDNYLQSKDVNVTDLQRGILVAVALQNKSYDETATLFSSTRSAIVDELRRLFKKSLKFFRPIFEPPTDSIISNDILTVSKLTKKSKNKKNKKRKFNELEENSATENK